MVYEEWLAQVPDVLKKDPIWQFKAYPKALLLFDLAWEDSERLQPFSLLPSHFSLVEEAKCQTNKYRRGYSLPTSPICSSRTIPLDG
jgi:hypothetical protein